MDDVLLKLLENPTALGLITVLAIVIYLTLRVVVHFGAEALRVTNEMHARSTQAFETDSSSSNRLLDKLVSISSKQSEATERMHVAIENNTVAFTSQGQEFQALVARFTVVEGTQIDLKAKIVEIHEGITTLSQNVAIWRERDKKILEQLNTNVENILKLLTTTTGDCNGTSIDQNSNPT